MTKGDIVKAVSASTHISPDVAMRAIDGFITCLSEAVAKGKRVEIRGFGVFQLKTRKSRPMQNFKTGERFIAPECKVPRFKFSKDFLKE